MNYVTEGNIKSIMLYGYTAKKIETARYYL